MSPIVFDTLSNEGLLVEDVLAGLDFHELRALPDEHLIFIPVVVSRFSTRAKHQEHRLIFELVTLVDRGGLRVFRILVELRLIQLLLLHLILVLVHLRDDCLVFGHYFDGRS